MNRGTARLVFIYISYSVLVAAVISYIVMNVLVSTTAGSFDRLNIPIVAGFWMAIASAILNGIIATREKGRHRVLAISGVIVSIGLVGLLIVPFTYAIN